MLTKYNAMYKRARAELHLAVVRLDGEQMEQETSPPVTSLLASNNLTASRKGVPSLAWPVCVSTVNRPCPTMHPPLDPAIVADV